MFQQYRSWREWYNDDRLCGIGIWLSIRGHRLPTSVAFLVYCYAEPAFRKSLDAITNDLGYLWYEFLLWTIRTDWTWRIRYKLGLYRKREGLI